MRVPGDEAAELRERAALATYGWGVVPVEARVGGTAFETSLVPRDGGYLLPLKNAVRLPLRAHGRRRRGGGADGATAVPASALSVAGGFSAGSCRTA